MVLERGLVVIKIIILPYRDLNSVRPICRLCFTDRPIGAPKLPKTDRTNSFTYKWVDYSRILDSTMQNETVFVQNKEDHTSQTY